MTEQDTRKFTIADVMILVAAAALGLVIHRYHRDSQTAAKITWPWPQSWLLEMAPYLLVCPPALLAARAMRPRPRARRVFRQPGTVACLACAFPVATNLVFFLLRRLFSPLQYPFTFLLYQILYMGSYVAIAWGVMALEGAWRPEPGWIDRVGRGLGIFLIVVWVVLGLTTW